MASMRGATSSREMRCHLASDPRSANAMLKMVLLEGPSTRYAGIKPLYVYIKYLEPHSSRFWNWMMVYSHDG